MKSTPFQLFVLAAFFGLGVIGIAFFALFEGGGGRNEVAPVTIWGTVDARVMQELINQAGNFNDQVKNKIRYEEKDSRTYKEELLEAFATGRGPDLFVVGQSDILDGLNKIFLIPYESYSERRFKNTFIEEGELYVTANGIVALPLIVDPLVMYWNRDILTREGIAGPPSFWDEFFTLSPRITKRDQTSNVLRSTVALGEFANITHAKDIISALIMQAGNPILRRGREGALEVILTENLGYAVSPAESALRFFTEFSNPVKAAYSWNRALPSSQNLFLAGDLAFYFGYASELAELRRKNPNLNFDVAPLPQVRDNGVKATFGRMKGLAIANTSQNKGGAIIVAGLLTSDPLLVELAKLTGLPPVSRALLGKPAPDAVQPVFYSAALLSRAWLEPKESETDAVFKEMVESITSGRKRIAEALRDAHIRLDQLIRK